MKITLLVHGNSDSVVLGALAYKFFTTKYKLHSIDVFFSHPAGLHADSKNFAKPGDIVFCRYSSQSFV